MLSAQMVLRLILSSSVVKQDVQWLWHPYMPKGMLTLIDGDPGVGKTWLTQSIAASVI